MKRLSIKLRVTLWFTLMMVLLVAAVLTFLIAAGEHTELLGARDTLTQTVAESFDELEWDDGVGIAPEALPRIWDRFYQADSSRSGGENGVGLGLPMVRYIVTAHGGTVSVKSAPGQGSTFFFTLPGKSDSL